MISEAGKKGQQIEKLIESLQDKGHKKAYAALKEIQSKSAESDAFSHFFNEFSGLLAAKNSYVIDVVRPEDALLSLMIVLAIDAAKCSSGN